MKESSIQYLLAEHERLKTMEQFRIQSFGRAQQLYLTVITAAAGALIFILGRESGISSLQISISLILGIVLLFGEITFIRLIGEDIALIEISKRYQSIRDKFTQEDPDLLHVFSKGIVQNIESFRFWSSIRGVIDRALTVSGPKTTVVLLNCFITVSIFINTLWSKIKWMSILIGIVIFFLLGFFHAIYSSLRYKKASKWLTTGSVGWWM